MAITSQGLRCARPQARCSSWHGLASAAAGPHRRCRPCGAAAGEGSDASDSAQPASSGGSSGSGSSFQRSPWELMGRVVREERIALQFDQQLNQGLVRSAAARESGLDVEEFEARLQRLFTLVPFLQQRMLRMQPKLLAALATDPERLAQRLIELKSLLPQADVASIVAQRPSLLLDGEWQRVPSGVAALAARYSEQEAARLATAEPLLLAEDLEHVLQELGRLAGAGGDAAAMLEANPALLYSVQSGNRALGPGAEF